RRYYPMRSMLQIGECGEKARHPLGDDLASGSAEAGCLDTAVGGQIFLHPLEVACVDVGEEVDDEIFSLRAHFGSSLVIRTGLTTRPERKLSMASLILSSGKVWISLSNGNLPARQRLISSGMNVCGSASPSITPV